MMNIKMCAAGLCGALLCGAAAGAVDVSTDTTLDADTDWRGQGTVTVAAGATLDLNGHLLQIDALAGAGRITDSQDYEVLEYVQSTGAQRVPTGYIPGANTMVETDFVSLGNSNGTLFGTKTWSGDRFLCMEANSCLYFFGSGNRIAMQDNVRYRSMVYSAQMSLFRLTDGTPLGYVAAGETNTDGTELMFFGISSGMAYCGKFRLYEARVWESKNLRLDLVPARNAATGAVGLFNRVDGALHVSDTGTALVAGTATGATLGVGSLRVAAADGTFCAGFTGTIDGCVRRFVDGTFSLTADTDWRAFGPCALDGSIDLAGHDLSLAALHGVGAVTESTETFDRLEYVESSGAQRVLTGVTPSTDTAVELEVSFTEQGLASSACTIIGCKTWGSNDYLMFTTANRNIYFFGTGQIPCQVAANTRYRLTVTPTTSPKGTFTVVNATTEQQVGSIETDLTNSDNSQLAVFAQSEEISRAGAFRLYSLKIVKAGATVRNFVPARNPQTGVVGLYDLVGQKLYASNTGTDLSAGPTTTTAGTAGSLHAEIAADTTEVNAGVALSGPLTLVKEGAGALIVLKKTQTYSGGTHMAAGTLSLIAGGWNHDFIGSDACLGTLGSELRVDAGATFDFAGTCDYRLYSMVLAGGTVRNSEREQVVADGSLGTMTLTADSRLDAVRTINFFDIYPCVLKLDGHTLTAATYADHALSFNNQGVVTNGGTFAVTGLGSLHIVNGLSARTAELRIECPLWLEGAIDAGDYTAACTTNLNTGTAALNVYGRFTPETDYFYGCTLQDGSTLDLNGKNGVWSTTSAFTNGSNRVTFADGATVTIDGHARAKWTGQIVAWGEGNAPANTSFQMDAASRRVGRNLAVRSDGLYATSGVMLIVR